MSNIYRAKGIKIADQYEDVGRLFKKQINECFEIDSIKMKMVDKVLDSVRSNPDLLTFYECFAGWARGAGIDEQHAMYLLADNTSGCQTAIVRYGSGVALLHTEEDYYDVSARMNTQHTIEFRDGARTLKCLTYNDLMPGAGLYGWQKDMIIAVDSLFLREDGVFEIERPMLANIIAWLIWYETPRDADANSIVAKLQKLGTMVDGYAINVVRRCKRSIEGYKVTFARDEWEVEQLGDKVGDNLRQVNIVEPEYARKNSPVSRYRHAPWKMGIDYYGFLTRLRNMKSHISEHRELLTQQLVQANIESVHKVIHKTIFEKYKKYYVTEWMGAMCVGMVDKVGLSVSTKLNDKRPSELVEYVDLILGDALL